MKKTTFLTALAALFILAACDKKEDEKPQTPSETKTSLLTNKDWKILDVGADSNNDGQVDAGTSEPQDSCSLDDSWFFKTDGTYLYKVGTVKCDPTETDEPGNWAFASNESQLVVDGDTFKIHTLSADRLAVGIDFGFGNTVLIYKR